MSANTDTEIMNSEFVAEKKIDLDLPENNKGKTDTMIANTEQKVKRVYKKKATALVVEPEPEPVPKYYISYEDADRDTESYVNLETAETEYNRIVDLKIYSWVQLCEVDGDKIIKEWATEEEDDADSVSSDESESDEEEEEEIDVETIKKQKAELEEKLRQAELKTGFNKYKKDKKQVQKDIKEYIDDKVAKIYKFCRDNNIEEWIVNMMPDGQQEFLGDNPAEESILIEKIYNMKNKPQRKASAGGGKATKPKSATAKVVVDGEEKEVGKARQKVIADANANVDKVVCYNLITSEGKIGVFRKTILCFVKDGKVKLPSVKEFNAVVDANADLQDNLIEGKKRKNFKEVCEWILEQV